MSADDKFGNKADEMLCKAKSGIGRATDDKSMEAEGKSQQSGANLKQAGEKVKDAFKK